MSKYISEKSIALFFACVAQFTLKAQPLNHKKDFTHQDTLRGSIGAGRDWWNVVKYHINTLPDYTKKTIQGNVEIEFDIVKPGANKKMQIDLQQPLEIDSILFFGKKIQTYVRDGNAFFIDFGSFDFQIAADDTKVEKGKQAGFSLYIYYHGKPREAVMPPWDGGWIFTKDAKGRPWMTVACQGLGASVWYPCKDHQSDEPDAGATLTITVADSLTGVSNGRLKNKTNNHNGTTSWEWEVKCPINNYTIVPYIGKYVNFTDTLLGEKGKLDISYWVLDYNLEKAKKQFGRDVKRMLHAFEYWFGPYPFYEDSYKLVESPHLGMEHQSAIAYGNKYLDGYLNSDLSGTGWGLKWDYIIVHESGHEWFGNNITTKDIADMWVHEGFTMYSEALFIEYYYAKKAADEYVAGLRKNISNDTPLIGLYGINREGSGDMYNKGANLIHTIRQIINNDSIFREILRGLNKHFYHTTTTTKEVEAYISKHSGKDFSKIFDQYLRTTQIPELIIIGNKNNITYKWANCIKDFEMPVKLNNGQWIYPSENTKNLKLSSGNFESILPDNNFYIKFQKSKS
ncbi:MAG TPA: M1 family metallopeptidase [Chitinophagaceae bacterium]|jgi:aminopeptidase N|nr:M1 family metallopeptidase [Chitinophagaceae bacterium]